MADWENPSNKNAKTLRIGIIPRVVCGASRVRTGDPLLAKQMPTSSLSGMRSNQLSYGPDPYASKAHK